MAAATLASPAVAQTAADSNESTFARIRRTKKMRIGAVGGGLAGNASQNRYVDRRPGQHIFVRLNNGVTIAVTEPADPALRVGDRVRVQGRGTDARLVRV